MSKDYAKLVLDAMLPGVTYAPQRLVRRVQASTFKLYPTIAWLCETGKLEKVKGPRHGDFTYRLAGEQPEEVPVTAPAYRNLRLTENLAGYSASLTSHMRLCMETRK